MSDEYENKPVGFVVWDAKYGLTYRGHVYETKEKAEQVLAGIVWHSRDRYEVRQIALVPKVAEYIRLQKEAATRQGLDKPAWGLNPDPTKAGDQKGTA